jgi:hypothetical protein
MRSKKATNQGTMALPGWKKATTDTALILYAELSAADIRAVQRLVKSGQLPHHRAHPVP